MGNHCPENQFNIKKKDCHPTQKLPTRQTYKFKSALLFLDCVLPVLASMRPQYQMEWKCNKIMNNKKSESKILFVALIFLGIFGMAGRAWAATLYVDNTLSADCVSGNYSIANRDCSGADGRAYNTIQKALNAVIVGDTVYMRGGTYTEKGSDVCNIILPTNRNGTAWTAGNFTTLASYPAEWAVLDGQGTANSGCVIGNPFSASSPHYSRVSYWKFERFEITGGMLPGGAGGNGVMRITEGPFWIRYLFFNSNITNSASDNPSALQIVRPEESIIEYNYFFNNGCTASGGYNASNCQQIWMQSDYCDELDNRSCRSRAVPIPDGATVLITA